LVTGNLWLVVKIARDYEKAARNLLDLVQEGNIGLMEAVKNFDPYRGVRFPSYAVWWIKAYIVRYIMANWRLVKIGTTQAQRKLFFNLRKEKDKLEREGFYPAPKLLAEKLNVKESEVIDMEQRLGSSEVSIDSPLAPDSESSLGALLPTPGPSAEDLLGQKQLRQLIERGFDEFSTTLNPNESVVFEQRLLGEDKATLEVVAEKLSLSKERVRQIENRVKEKLREFLLKKFGAVVENLEF
jgi:RNA polymerase sigma-32 factor